MAILATLEAHKKGGWISVKERPLFEVDSKGNWVCTKDGEGEFMAAIEENTGWWIHHCVIEDEIGLCVVGDTYNEPAGYDLKDVQYYRKISPPTKEKP